MARSHLAAKLAQENYEKVLKERTE